MVINKFSNIITTEAKTVYFLVFSNDWIICLLTQLHSGLLVSKQLFQIEYSIIGKILKNKLY